MLPRDSAQMLRVIKERIHDYDAGFAAKRDELVACWRAAHPEAAKEVSIALHPLMLADQRAPGDDPRDPDEIWVNDVYQVTLRRKEDVTFGTRGGMIQLGISSHDGMARPDFRDMQAIKNQLAGAECEAFELYPAESRLLDPSNYYALWCFPGLRRIKVGVHDPRRVWDADVAWAPQRAGRWNQDMTHWRRWLVYQVRWYRWAWSYPGHIYDLHRGPGHADKRSRDLIYDRPCLSPAICADRSLRPQPAAHPDIARHHRAGNARSCCSI
jgi:hypothetical protein